MGLFDQIKGMFSGSNNSQLPLNEIVSWIEQQGNLSGFLDKFRANGFGDIIQSWLGGDNKLPITGEQVTQALGSDSLAQLANKVGMNIQSVSGLLAEQLPKLIGHFSSTGVNINEIGSDLLHQGLDFLKKQK